MWRFLFAVFLVVSCATGAAADSFEDAASAHERGDYTLAARLFRPLAEQGNALAQSNLGAMYADGQGVPQDDQEAMKWFRKAAEQGNALAQYNLGVAYANGEGVSQDYPEAVKWYRKAAGQENASAQYNLASMYFSGHGVPQDYVLAHMWANRAALKNTEYVKKRDAIASFMTPSQIAEAQKLAREWKPTTATSSDRAQETGASERASSGTGFVVSRQGHVLTSQHVIEGCRTRSEERL